MTQGEFHRICINKSTFKPLGKSSAGPWPILRGRSNEALTASALTGVPSANFALSLRVKIDSFWSSEAFQPLARSLSTSVEPGLYLTSGW